MGESGWMETTFLSITVLVQHLAQGFPAVGVEHSGEEAGLVSKHLVILGDGLLWQHTGPEVKDDQHALSREPDLLHLVLFTNIFSPPFLPLLCWNLSQPQP